MPFFFSFGTAFGTMAMVWSIHGGRPCILRTILPGQGMDAVAMARAAYPGAQGSSCPETDRVAAMIRAFLEGKDVVFPLDAVRMDLVGPFQQRVLRAEHGIPRGRVSTYGRIAGFLGMPGGARAVGTALAANPFPIMVPCHRAVRSDGSLGGYQGGTDMKRALLEMEGVPFTAAGRVDGRVFYY